MTSPRMAKLSWAGEVFYRRLMSVVDDYGRFHGHPTLLRAACYPAQIDKVSDADIGKWLGETSEAALVSVYEVCGQRYLELLDFRQQMRAKLSKFPDPPPDAQRMHSECKANAKQMHTLGEGEGEGGPAPRKRASPKRPLPEDFAISDRVKAWAERQGVLNLEVHFAYFVSRAKAKGYTYADWDEGFMGAIRDNWAKVGNGQPKAKKVVV